MNTNSETFFGNIEKLQLTNAIKCNYEVGQGKDIISEKWNLNLIFQQKVKSEINLPFVYFHHISSFKKIFLKMASL